MKDLTYLMIVTLVLASTQAFAEMGGSTGLTGQTVIQSGGSSGGQDPLVSAALADPGTIQDNNAANEGRGRREKLDEDAIPKGKAGVGAAIAAGTALLASGIPLLPFPTTPRGVKLITMAGIEFAQAAATAGVNAKNQKARDAVGPAQDGPTGSQLSPEAAKAQAAASVNTPELQKFLGDRGINSDDFIDKLVSGQLNSPEAVSLALGVDQNDAASASAEMAASYKDSNGAEDVARLAFAEGKGINNPNGDGSNGSGGGNSNSSGLMGGANGDGHGGSADGGADPALVAQAQALAERTLELAKKAGTADGMELKQLTEKYLAALSGKNGNAAQMAAWIHFDRLGIRKLRKNQNIFHVARKSYRDFGHWRSKTKRRATKVAQAR